MSGFERAGAARVLYDERTAVMFADIVDGANARMIQRRRGPRLALESLQSLPVAGKLFRQKLQGHAAFKPQVFALIDDTHAATAQLRSDLVMRNDCANHSAGILHGGWGKSGPIPQNPATLFREPLRAGVARSIA